MIVTSRVPLSFRAARWEVSLCSVDKSESFPTSLLYCALVLSTVTDILHK